MKIESQEFYDVSVKLSNCNRVLSPLLSIHLRNLFPTDDVDRRLLGQFDVGFTRQSKVNMTDLMNTVPMFLRSPRVKRRWYYGSINSLSIAIIPKLRSDTVNQRSIAIKLATT